MDFDEVPYDSFEDINNEYMHDEYKDHYVAFAWCPALDRVMERLSKEPVCDTRTADFLQSINEYSRKAGYVTKQEARRLGGIWKDYINGGVYVHHDWWDNAAKLTEDDVETLKAQFKAKMKIYKEKR